VCAITSTEFEHIKNVSTLNFRKCKSAPRWFHGGTNLFELKKNTAHANDIQVFSAYKIIESNVCQFASSTMVDLCSL
jgi:hypothetical protein